MTTSSLLSIDIESEIEKITQKQHLNHVHFAVQMVRHAARHQPKMIEVRCNRSYFEITQNGSALDPEEDGTLATILGGKDLRSRQEALSRCEHHYGITLLALIMENPSVYIESGNSIIQYKGAHRQAESHPHPISGYRIRVKRRRRGNEAREILFFCRHCDIPIKLNGKFINAPLFPRDQLLTYRVSSAEGVGFASINAQDRLHETVYLKQGIRFGIKKTKPLDDHPFQCIWNATTPHIEEHFQNAIQSGDTHLPAAKQALVQGLVSGYLVSRNKREFKQYLLRLEDDQWYERFGLLPLFAGGDGPFTVSCHQLRGLENRYGFIPYLTKRSRIPSFPILDQQERYFLNTRLKLKTMPAYVLGESDPIHLRLKRLLFHLWRRRHRTGR